MKESYKDITSRIAEAPTWWDSNGAPRYGEFSPGRCPNIYSDTVVLLKIACQNCGKEFDVEMNLGFFDPDFNPLKLHYGDPPIHDCTGDTMNCDDLEVLQIWHRNSGMGNWKRIRKIEGKMD